MVAEARRLSVDNKGGHNKVHTCRARRKENKTLTCPASSVLPATDKNIQLVDAALEA